MGITGTPEYVAHWKAMKEAMDRLWLLCYQVESHQVLCEHGAVPFACGICYNKRGEDIKFQYHLTPGVVVGPEDEGFEGVKKG